MTDLTALYAVLKW